MPADMQHIAIAARGDHAAFSAAIFQRGICGDGGAMQHMANRSRRHACLAAKAAGAAFVKTSTGFSTGGATAADIALMRKTVGPDMGVKASGGVRTREQAFAMIEAGATRIGCSSTKTIMG